MSGRERLARLKREHEVCEGGGCGHGWARARDGHCNCGSAQPCEMRLLVAAVEEALSYWAEDHPIAVAILSKLEDR